MELKPLSSPGPQCGICAHYQELQSRVQGYHSCKSYPRILVDIVEGDYKCQVGPVLIGRRLAQPAPVEVQEPAPTAPPVAAAAVNESADAPAERRRGRPRSSAGK